MTEKFVIVGAGPAGMAAAITIACEGIIPTVIDAQQKSGGQIWRGAPQSNLHQDFNHMVEKGAIRFLSDTTVIDAQDQTLFTTKGKVTWSRLILATGARELFLPFPGWTLPRVMGAGGLQAAYKSGLNVKGKRIVIAGSGPLLLAVGAALIDAGADVTGIFEQAPFPRVATFGLKTALAYGKLNQAVTIGRKIANRFKAGTWIKHIEEGDHLHVTLNTGQILEADYVAVVYGLVPNLELPRLLGCQIKNNRIWTTDALQTSKSTIWLAGEITGIGGVDAALVEGQLAARSALELNTGNLTKLSRKWKRYEAEMESAYRLRDEVRELAENDTIVCRCEGVNYGSLKVETDPIEAKLDHRIGMGWCQGRVCGAACRELFGWPDASVRPPLFPIAAAQYANLLGEHDES